VAVPVLSSSPGAVQSKSIELVAAPDKARSLIAAGAVVSGIANVDELITFDRPDSLGISSDDHDDTVVLSLESPLKHIVSVEQFTRNHLRYIFDKAFEMKQLVLSQGKSDLLKDKLIGLIFYEPSTRTRCSFETAMKRLGGSIIEISSSQSSVTKGESLQDFAKCIQIYTDGIILRSPELGSAEMLSKILIKPIINAGDGSGEHPTQALLDIYTIREERGTVNGLTITLVGDLKYGRTVHSLAKLLSLYNVKLQYVSPRSLKMPDNIKSYIAEKGIEQMEYTKLDDVIANTDILYMTRLQKERFIGDEQYSTDMYQLTPHILTKAKSKLVIMHPLPRLNEITPEIDGDHRAAYFRQMENGLYIRMALLAIIFQ